MTTTLIESVFHILILTPLFIWGSKRNKSTDLKPVLFFVIIYVLTQLILHKFSNVTLFPEQKWNWVGKGVALITGLFFVFIIPKFNRKQFGLTTKINWVDTNPLLRFCLIYLFARIGLYAFSDDATLHIQTETIFYQATIPGLQEEILFRGLLFGLLSSIYLIPTFKFLKVNFGLATIITSILFGLTHSVNLNDNFNFDFDYFAFFRTTFDGFIFALLMEKTKSILPSIMYHNLLNIIGLH